jgi:DNA-binding IclR family transcriptional regulator
VAVLELLAAYPAERFTLSEVARRCEFNKATAHALLATLSDHGVLLRHPDEKRYSLGPRLVAIGEAARRGYTALDFAPGALERLAARTGCWARAFVRRDDVVAQVAQAGVPGDVDPDETVVLPLVPPVGMAWMAWSDGPSVEAWLARATSADVVPAAVEALPAIRLDEFVVTPATAEWCRLSEPRRARGRGRSAGSDDGRALLAALGRAPLVVTRLDDGRSYRVAELAAPVFWATGEVALVMTLSGLGGNERTGADVRLLAAEVTAAARGLTAAVRGREPRSGSAGT